MVFVETSVFTSGVLKLLDDGSYSAMQLALLLRPEAGAVIRHSGGLRKLRWTLPGQGKRGGIRVIYFWYSETETIYLLYAYPKNKQEDLTPKQLKTLRRLVLEEIG